MGRLVPVVRREYVEQVRTKGFLIGTILGPVVLGLLMAGPLILSKQRGKALRVVVHDATGQLQAAVEAALADAAHDDSRFQVERRGEPSGDERRVRLREDVLQDRLDGYVYLPPNAVESATAEYYGRNVSNVRDLRRLDETLHDVMVAHRLTRAGLPASRVEDVTRRLDLKRIRISARGEREDRGASILFSTLLMMILYMSVVLWGQALMQGVIEEKSNRVVEIAISSLAPTQLLAGKLLGVGAAGLTQLLVWTISMAVLSAFGAGAFAAAETGLPEVSLGVLAAFVGYFLLGFFFYAALYAGIGAAVNTGQEAQGLVFPVMSPMVAATVMFPIVLQQPDGRLATVFSLVPPFTPILMFLRISVLPPPAWQIALSVVLTVLAIAGVTWAAARVFRTGILMYGKRPTFPEILRWVAPRRSSRGNV